MDFVDGKKDGDIIEYMNIEYFTLFSDKGVCVLKGDCLNEFSFENIEPGDYHLILNYTVGKIVCYNLKIELGMFFGNHWSIK